MIYLNNAATSFPKPDCVTTAYMDSIHNPPASQFRSFGFETESVEVRCKKKLGELLGIHHNQQIFFTSGATDALNQVIHGICLQCTNIVTTDTEHNSVLRPLYNLPVAKDCHIYRVPCDSYGNIPFSYFEDAIDDSTDAVIVNHCSNVTGAVVDLAVLGKLVHKHHALFIVDASQSAGVLPLYTDEWGIDILIFTGHKGLLGAQGTGGFYLHPDLCLIPQRFGGTGRDSRTITYEDRHYEYETGTQNLPGITALLAGVSYLLSQPFDQMQKQEQQCMQLLYQELSAFPQVTIYGTYQTNPGYVLSFNIAGLLPSDVAYILFHSYDIHIRTGLHCAPLIHEHLGTLPQGTVRISISTFTTQAELLIFVEAIRTICSNLNSEE
ncbi:MAG: aminotransferase class V-fold PLP-dependent enzyme [Lachnospiraceae bacterium]